MPKIRLAILSLTAAALLGTALPASAQEVIRVPQTPGVNEAAARSAFAKLDTLKVSVDFEDTPVQAAVAFLRQVSGINILIDSRVTSERAIDEMRITLQVTDVSLRTALNFVCEFSDLVARWKHSVLMLTTVEHGRGKPVAKMYDVRDITLQLKDFPGPEIKLEASADGGAGIGGLVGGDEEDGTPTRDQIMDMLQQMLPGAWDLPGASIGTFGGAILIRQYPEIHRQIHYVLTLIRGAR